MNKEEFISKIWEYYLMLEENFYYTFKYVEPCEDNDTTYSKEYGKMLLSICSEIDITCKELCKVIENKNSEEVSNYNILNYKQVISINDNFMNESCTFLKSNEILQPWKEWNTENCPSWWKDYNSLKHDRLLKCNYKLGNYYNVKNSIAGLYIICRILYRKQFDKEPFPCSRLFKMNNWTEYRQLGGGFFSRIESNGNMGIYTG